MGRHDERTTPVAGLYEASRIINGQVIAGDVSLEIFSGEITLLTGKSGSGKSTVMRMLQGIERPDSGQARLFGQDLAQLDQASLGRLKASRVGVGFQASNLDTGLTVRENLIGFREATGRAVDISYAAQIAIKFGLAESLHKQALVLSGGEKQRLAFASMILQRPEILLLDEPTGALDDQNTMEMLGLITDTCHNEGMSALIVAQGQDANMFRPFAHRELVMNSGRLVAEHVLQPPAVGLSS